MTHIIANPVSAGLAVTIDDPDAERIIAARVPIVLRHLTTWRERDNQPALSAAEQRNPGLLLPWFQELERRVERVDAGDAVAIQQGLATWRDAYTIPLAADLGLIQIAADLVLHHCYRRGSFDRLAPDGRRERPTETVTLPQVQQILATTEATSRRVAALVAQGLCRTADVATTVVEAVRRVHDRSADQARGIVLAYGTYGEIGLLVASAYPAIEEVLLLLQHTAYVVAHSAAPAATLSQLIADLLALRAALQAADPALWQRRLLHEPAVSSYRQAYQRTLWTHRRTLILTALTQGGRYDAADATQLRDALLTGGLARLLDLRCQLVPGTTAERFERQRTQQAIATTFAVLSAADRTVLTHLLTHLQDAMEETGVGLPLAALIASYPSSWRRRHDERQLDM